MVEVFEHEAVDGLLRLVGSGQVVVVLHRAVGNGPQHVGDALHGCHADDLGERHAVVVFRFFEFGLDGPPVAVYVGHGHLVRRIGPVVGDSVKGEHAGVPSRIGRFGVGKIAAVSASRYVFDDLVLVLDGGNHIVLHTFDVVPNVTVYRTRLVGVPVVLFEIARTGQCRQGSGAEEQFVYDVHVFSHNGLKA